MVNELKEVLQLYSDNPSQVQIWATEHGRTLQACQVKFVESIAYMSEAEIKTTYPRMNNIDRIREEADRTREAGRKYRDQQAAQSMLKAKVSATKTAQAKA